MDRISRHLVRNDPHALLRQRVLHVEDALLISRDDARGEDDRITLIQCDMAMGVIRDTAERGALLALAAGAEIKDLVARKGARLGFVDQVRQVGEHTCLHRRIDDLVHASSSQTDAPAGKSRRFDHGCDTRHIRSESSHGHTAFE